MISAYMLVLFCWIFSYYGSQWDQKLSGYWYSSKYQKISWIYLKMVKPNCLTLGGLVKWTYFQKKVEYPFNKINWSILFL